MKRMFVCCLLVGAWTAMADDLVTVKSVTAQQRYPWNGLVDITVTFEGESNDVANAWCQFAATNCATKEAISVSHITRRGCVGGSDTTWTRKFVWNAAVDVGAIKVDDVALTVDADLGVQLWENGPYWAKCNVGALKPEDSGYYFWWGDTVGYKRNASNNGWISVKDGSAYSFSGCPTYGMNNSSLQSQGYIDSTGNLVAAHDAATAHLGAPWRMPTDAEFAALISNCTTTWTTRNGVYGRLVTGKGTYATKCIFLPAAGIGYGSSLSSTGSYGYYWSSTPNSDSFYYAWYLYFTSGYFARDDFRRYYGQSVRPVRGFSGQTGNAVGNSMATRLKLDCRTGLRVPSAEGEVLHYDASWYESGDEVRISDNGTVIKTGTFGSHIWYSPSDASLRTLKLEVLSSGEVIGTETAQFGLGYVRNVTARQLWPHSKVEVCYTLADDIGDAAKEGTPLELFAVTGSTTNRASTVLGRSDCVSGRHCVVLDCWADGALLDGTSTVFIVKYGEVSGASEPTSLQVVLEGYVKNGLLARFDGRENVGQGVHSDSAASWCDLTGNGWNARKSGSSGSWISNGYRFVRGSDGFFSLPSGLQSQLGTSWTVEVCFRPCEGACENYSGICGAHQGNYARGLLLQSADQKLGAAIHNSGIGDVTVFNGKAAWPFGQVTRLAFSMDNAAGETRVCVNGDVIGRASFTPNTAPTLTDPSFYIGRAHASTDRQFDGDIFALRVYDRALSLNEVRQNQAVDEALFAGGSQGVIVVTNNQTLVYSPIDAENVSLEVNGTTVCTDTKDGTFNWTPSKPGTYVLTHRAGAYVFSRNVICTNAADMSQLEIGWLDQPVSNLFPSIYASVTNIVIAPPLTRVSENAFAGCAGIEYDVVDGIMMYKGVALGIEGECPTDVVLPEGTQVIADGAFRNCSTLTNLVMPVGIKTIGAHAFSACTFLKEIVIPEGVETIGEGAFENCTSVEEVEFPTSLISIGDKAFSYCHSLQKVYCGGCGLESIGEGAFSNCWSVASVDLPATVDKIGAHAFYRCNEITDVTIPAHVDTIANLFPDVYQEKLTSVTIAEGETELTAGVFSGCESLEEVELSDLIEEIPDSAFEGCTELRRIRFPESLVRIGNRAFYGCGQVWQLEFPEGLEEIGDDAFNGLQQVRDLVCPSSVRKIGARAFRGVWNDEEVKLPEGLESLGVDAFANCSAIRRVSLPVVMTPIKSAFPDAYSQISTVEILGRPEEIPQNFCQDIVRLSDIKIPESVTNICNYAFAGLSNLAAIELPPNLLAIGAYAFSGDSRLVTIDLPANLTTVGEYAFNGNGNLVTVSIPQSVTSIGYRAFWGCGNVRIVSCPGDLATMSTLFPSAYGQITTVSINAGSTRVMDDLLSGCSKLTEVNLPIGVETIGSRAFQNCSSLTTFGVPQGVISIGSDVFSGCTGITALSLPEGLTSIPSGAFRNCSAISELVIPASVSYLGGDAFSGCVALKLISYLGNCPEYDSGCYNGTQDDLVSKVVNGSLGWDGIATSPARMPFWPIDNANSRKMETWEPNIFIVTFDGNGGYPSSTQIVQTTGMTYILPEDDPTMTGARFNGWWNARVNGGRIKTTTTVNATRAQTFYAHWKYNTYTVRFDANGGFGEMDDLGMTVNTPEELLVNGFLRKGHRFAGWSTLPDGEVEFADGAEVGNLALEQDAVVTLYAVWTESAWGAAEYLNAPGRSFAVGGDAVWTADDEVSHDGIGSMRSGAIAAAHEEGDHTTSVLSTTVMGEGTGSFWWKVDCEPSDEGTYYDYCSFSIDGVVVTNIAGQADWEKIEYAVSGEGEHVLKWTFARDDYDEDETLYENAAWVDELVWTPTPVTLSFAAGGAGGDVPASLTKYAGYSYTLPSAMQLSKTGFVFVGWSDGETVYSAGEVYAFGFSDAVLTAVWEEKVWTLSEAANVTNATLTTGGAAEWIVDLATNYDGVASIRSGAIGHSQESWVSMNVTGAGTIAFRALVSGEYYRGSMRDYLKFEVDGTMTYSSYDACWSNVVVEVSGTGEHALKWTYLKNESKTVGLDCACIDVIAWTPAASSDPIPDLGDEPTVEEITNVLTKAEDPKLAEKITTEAAYTNFSAWAKKVQPHGGGDAVGAAGVMAAANAWVSYALGSETLLETAPTDADLTVEAFEPTTDETKPGQFDFTVSVKDVEVGAGGSAETVKENLKQVFGLEGGTTLGEGGMSSANVEIEFGTPQDGKVKFTAGPKDTEAKTFFMKVRVK